MGPRPLTPRAGKQSGWKESKEKSGRKAKESGRISESGGRIAKYKFLNISIT
jgi:hypothetical protein